MLQNHDLIELQNALLDFCNERIFFSITCCRRGGLLRTNLTAILLYWPYSTSYKKKKKKHIPQYPPRHWHPGTFLFSRHRFIGLSVVSRVKSDDFSSVEFLSRYILIDFYETFKFDIPIHNCFNFAHRMAE